ncbi:hypothetical protein AB4K20DRAFT_1187103 [Rhizopus microsporus]
MGQHDLTTFVSELDVITGELARHSSTASSKLYGDFLNSALTTKVHLNTTLKRMLYIPPKQDQNRCCLHDPDFGIILYYYTA